MATEDEARIARTESAFRRVNEGIAETAEFFGSDETEFICECADARCQDRIEAPLAVYEDVRAESTQFLVAEGHEVPAYEHVRRRRRGYLIVEKVARGLAAAVRRADPRSQPT